MLAKKPKIKEWKYASQWTKTSERGELTAPEKIIEERERIK